MEKLVENQTSIAIRGTHGKLGSLVKQSFEADGVKLVSIDRETDLGLIKGPLIILDFTGPNPKNKSYWESFDLDRNLYEYTEFLEWARSTHSFYIRVGTIGEFNSPLTEYEYVASQISRTVNEYLAVTNLDGCILYPSNIYGRNSLKNFVEVAMERYFQRKSLTLENGNKVVNFIHFEDMMYFISKLVKDLQFDQKECPSFRLSSPTFYSISILNEYIAMQVVDFKVARELKQELLQDIPLIDANSQNIKSVLLPNKLKSYIDSIIMSEIGSGTRVS